MKPIKIFCAALLACVCLPDVAYAGGWALFDTKDGIRSYKKSYAGTQMCEFKSLGFVDASVDVVLAVLRDVAAYSEWSPMCDKTTVLEDIDQNNKVFYNYMKRFVLLKDRDMVLRQNIEFDYKNGTAQVYFWISDTPPVPLVDGCDRMTDYTGQYRLAFFGCDRTMVTYEQRVVADTDAFAPVGQGNLLGLRNMVQKQAYIQRGRDSVEHLLIGRMIDSTPDIRRVLINRMGDYISDPDMLALALDEKPLAEAVLAEGATFASLVAAITGVFQQVLTSPTVGDYIKDKPLEDFLILTSLAEETWMAKSVFRNKQVIKPLLYNGNGVFEKILQSKYAVAIFIKDPDLMNAIVSRPEIRKKILRDPQFKAKVLAGLDKFTDPQALEPLVVEALQP